MYIYKIYNLSFRDYDTIYNKKNLLAIATTLYISNKNILVENFNFCYTIKKDLFYLQQYLLFNKLIDIITKINVLLILLQNTIIRNY